jgi:hypothetical protein
VSRRAKARLWLRYALRRHQMTGRRVKRLRWSTITGDHGRPVHKLGAWDRDVWVGWEWR